MTSHNREHPEHLTTEQLSAYLDKQLTPEEQAVFAAHLQTCQTCQQRLAELRYTVSLVRALPKVEAPRSFTLPASMAPISIERARQERAQATSQQRRAGHSLLRRTIRTVSTLAAIVGVIFVLYGLQSTLARLGHIGGATMGSAPASSSAGQAGQQHAPTMSPHASSTAISRNLPSAGATAAPAPTPVSTADNGKGATPPSVTTPNTPGLTIPPVLDITMPVGRLGVGLLVLFLGIIGLIATRRRRGANPP